MAEYIHQLTDWPRFTWDSAKLINELSEVSRQQGALLGKMRAFNLPSRREAMLKTLTEEIITSNAIEGEKLDPQSVRSSIARRLRLNVAGVSTKENRNVEGVVEMMLDATQHYDRPLTMDRLYEWHADLFPGVRTTADKFRVGAFRNSDSGEMQVVSGAIGKERIHYEAPAAEKLDEEMNTFVDWFNGDKEKDWILKAGIAHLWFVTIHPFEDGNGRIARAIAEMCLARSDKSAQRFYSMSAQILEEKSEYYRILEKSQKGALDITGWLSWFLSCLDRAIDKSEKLTEGAIEKESFWNELNAKNVAINDRQKKMLNKLLTGFNGKLTTTKWAKITDCSPRTALSDIELLVDAGVLEQDPGGGRSTSYSLRLHRE
jgi:Fic family protein